MRCPLALSPRRAANARLVVVLLASVGVVLLAAGCRTPSPGASVGTTVTGQPCPARRSAAELRDAAGKSAGDSWPLLATLTPPLPTRWPEAGGGVLFLTYRLSPLPTGRIAFRVRGPERSILFATLDAAPIVGLLDPTRVLGDTDRPSDTADTDEAHLIDAAEVVVDVIAGCRQAEDARAALEPYAVWLAANEPIARDLVTRAPDFLRWLRPPR
jgi:hypothetical protein